MSVFGIISNHVNYYIPCTGASYKVSVVKGGPDIGFMVSMPVTSTGDETAIFSNLWETRTVLVGFLPQKFIVHTSFLTSVSNANDKIHGQIDYWSPPSNEKNMG